MTRTRVRRRNFIREFQWFYDTSKTESHFVLIYADMRSSRSAQYVCLNPASDYKERGRGSFCQRARDLPSPLLLLTLSTGIYSRTVTAASLLNVFRLHDWNKPRQLAKLHSRTWFQIVPFLLRCQPFNGSVSFFWRASSSNAIHFVLILLVRHNPPPRASSINAWNCQKYSSHNA